MLHEHHFRAMNTDVGVWRWSTTPERVAILGRSLKWAEVFFARVEDELSRFRSTSALSRLNGAAGCGPQVVSPLFWTVLMSAMKAADDSGAIYDPTLLRTLERIGYDRTFDEMERCGRNTLADVPSFGSWRRVGLDSGASSVSLPADLALDFGGIAKGWTVDRVALVLAPLGPVLVDAGGDLRAIGMVDGEAWPIAVQDPFEPERDRAVVRLAEGALARAVSVDAAGRGRPHASPCHRSENRDGGRERPPFRDRASTECRDGRCGSQGGPSAGQCIRRSVSA
jgi:thiamine biosynthesis lipoprotein